MDAITHRSALQSILAGFIPVVAVLLLAGCGIGDSGDQTAEVATSVVEPEATSVATVDATIESASNATGSPAGVLGDGTPTDSDATPTPEIVVSAPRIAVPTSLPDVATPEPPQAGGTPGDSGGEPAIPEPEGGIVGDGTGGAGRSPATVEAVSSPQTDTSGAEVSVSSCDVGFYSPYRGNSPNQVTTSEVNFRTGPGTDCDLLGEPLETGTAVEILSTEIIRDDQDSFVWVAVSVDGTDGWIATDFIEPVDDQP